MNAGAPSILAALVLQLAGAPVVGAEPSRPSWATVESALHDLVGRPLQTDLRLDEAAAELAADILRERVLDEEGRGFAAARDHLWTRGVADPLLAHVAIRFEGVLTEAAVRGALESLERPQQYTHAGYGVSGGEPACAVILLTRRTVEILEPTAWDPAVAGPLRLATTPDVVDPRLWIVAPDARATELSLQPADGGHLTSGLPADSVPGVYRLEVVSGEDSTLHALALGEIAPPTGWEGAPVDDSAAEAYLRSMLEMERKHLGLAPVEPHPALSEVAREHSLQLRSGIAFGHRSPDLPAERVQRTGLPHSRVLENVARAPTLDMAHALIMASPEHRANLLDPHVTHAGVGAARSEPLAWYVTQELVRLLPPLELSLVREQAREAVADARRQRGKPPLRPKRALDRIAQRWAEAVGRADLTALGEAQIRELTGEVRFHLDDVERVVADLAWVEAVDQLEALPQLDAPGLDQVGVGLYQDPAGGMLAVIVVLVDRAIP